ncbi:DUF3489 domain-containing protein [Novosphingobium sp. TH158]|uniref:DUF3489 domain-containing protein n=1 Tax=Novosphingobium sp. TH158 TaxID=2067455 RepID=UPI000C7E46E0|nr:DUF3489 domain-containing protein [Novosphingobium sp. TH158]PLK26694.1 hypothetical protein C0V78_07195 [Novosphingobium sp. TH158]
MEHTNTSAAQRPRRMAREPQADAGTQVEAQPAIPSKRDAVIALLSRPEGASIDEMVAATGWLPHTTRAMLTGLRKKGHAITRDKVDGITRYRMTAAATA